MFTANKKPDVENAADAKKPGDKKEDVKTMKTSQMKSAKKAVAPLVAKKLRKHTHPGLTPDVKSPFPPKY